MSRIDDLAEQYERHISAPWQRNLAGAQRIIFVVYPKEDERRRRAKMEEFEQRTKSAGHGWREVNITDFFPAWMASDEYREEYFNHPEDLALKLDGEFATTSASRLIEELTAEDKRAAETAAFNAQSRSQVILLIVGGLLMGLIGAYAPAAFMGHFIVFVLAVFIGFQVIWGVSHSLHTPLMAITNAVSGIIVLGALLQIGADGWLIQILSAIAILIATINIVGGFMVTRRMLQMFQKS